MFFILNKPKIYSYLIVLSTVMVLFFTAAVLSESPNLETQETSTQSVIQEKPIERVNTEKRMVGLTINCLETDKNIDSILETLENNSIKATFCICGEWVKEYPELALKINEKGHSIANMSDTYKDMSDLSYTEVNNNMKEGENKLSSLLNKEIKLFRCPYGKYSENLIRAANDNFYTVIGCDIDTLDYSGIEASVIWDNIKNKVSSGSIISMNSNAQYIVEEIKLVTQALKEREYKVVTVEELINL